MICLILGVTHYYKTKIIFRNEKEVGEGLKKSGIKREDVFIVTKVFPDADHHGYNEAIQGVKDSLER